MDLSQSLLDINHSHIHNGEYQPAKRDILIVIELNLSGTFDQIIWLANQNNCLLFYMIPWALLDGDLLKYVK